MISKLNIKSTDDISPKILPKNFFTQIRISQHKVPTFYTYLTANTLPSSLTLPYNPPPPPESFTLILRNHPSAPSRIILSEIIPLRSYIPHPHRPLLTPRIPSAYSKFDVFEEQICSALSEPVCHFPGAPELPYSDSW